MTAPIPLEYAAIRLALALSELGLAFLIVRRNAPLFGWMLFCFCAGVANLIPALLRNPLWERWLWAPPQALVLLVLLAAVLDTYTFTLPHMGRGERMALASLAALVAGIVIGILTMTWRWWGALATFMRIREFGALAMALGHSFGWLCVTWIRPVPKSPLAGRHGLLLYVFLWCYWIGCSTVEGGSLWLLPWRQEQEMMAWRIFNDGTMAVQVILLVLWSLSLRTQPQPKAVSALVRAHRACL